MNSWNPNPDFNQQNCIPSWTIFPPSGIQLTNHRQPPYLIPNDRIIENENISKIKIEDRWNDREKNLIQIPIENERLQDLKEQNQNLIHEIKFLRETNEKQNAEIQELKQNLDCKNQGSDSLRNELCNLYSIKEKIQQDASYYSQKYMSAKKENEKLIEQLKDARRLTDKFKKKARTEDSAVNDLKRKLSQVGNELKEKQIKIDIKNEKIEEMAEATDTLHSKLISMQAILDSKSQVVIEMEMQFKDLKTKIQSNQSKLEYKELLIDKLQVKFAETQMNYEKLVKVNESLNEQRGKITFLETQNKFYKQNIKNLEGNLESFEKNFYSQFADLRSKLGGERVICVEDCTDSSKDTEMKPFLIKNENLSSK